jgi:hypothetical protein
MKWRQLALENSPNSDTQLRREMHSGEQVMRVKREEVRKKFELMCETCEPFQKEGIHDGEKKFPPRKPRRVVKKCFVGGNPTYM